ncbi:MAG: apolipoprotein N-acyltransferase [Candidatus Cloacimonetes bacterium]|nr:apolipoprotein N-acyltransferase [Candidatus Cloacimonadota bacterium]
MKNWHLAIISGLLFGLSFIDIGLGFLSFFAYVPYLAFIILSNSKKSFWCGFLFGFVLNIITQYPIMLVRTYAFIGLIIAMSFYFAILSLFIKKVHLKFPKAFFWFFPIIWIAFEYFMTLGSLNFPWLNVGYSLTAYYYLIQFSDMFGIYGISFLILIINILIFKIFSSKFRTLFIIISIFILWFGYGIYKHKIIKLKSTNLKVGIVQLNILQENKWDSALLDSTVNEYGIQISKLTSEERNDLIILPESAITTYLLHEKEYMKKLSEMARTNNVNLVVGFPDYNIERIDKKRKYKFYNSATMIDREGNYHPKYDKIRLVPFGERIPLLSTFAFLEKLQFGQANFEYGVNPLLYKIDEFEFPILICFEGVFPELSRKYAKRGADFIIVITNDAWFKKTVFPVEHANNTKIRAIETRLALFRAANTGISYIINPKGNIIQQADVYEKKNLSGFLSTKIRDSKLTFFVKAGYLFPIFCFWFSIILIIYSIISTLIMVKNYD